MTATSTDMRKKRRYSYWIVGLGIVVVALVCFVMFVHPFLAVTARVDADVLVVEGWIPGYMLPAAAKEFREGHYSLLLVSGLQNDPSSEEKNEPTDAVLTSGQLEQLGIPHDAVMPCPAPFARWLRTSRTAGAVKEKTATLQFKPRGINVITAGPHARETWVAYQHIFGASPPVGIISIPKNNYPANRWWLSRQGLIWVPKDFLAWMKEVIFGLRS
ncbi:MAG TPA: hypothetical protein VGM64_02935 [Lacunisphaera sp.]|jgi:hypothetical protein